MNDLRVRDLAVGDRLECINAFGDIAAGQYVRVIGIGDWDIVINVKSRFTGKPMRLGDNGTRWFRLASRPNWAQK